MASGVLECVEFIEMMPNNFENKKKDSNSLYYRVSIQRVPLIKKRISVDFCY